LRRLGFSIQDKGGFRGLSSVALQPVILMEVVEVLKNISLKPCPPISFWDGGPQEIFPETHCSSFVLFFSQEQLLLDPMFNVPGSDIIGVCVDEDVVRSAKKPHYIRKPANHESDEAIIQTEEPARAYSD